MNYLKKEISVVSEFKLKQLKQSGREEFLLFDFFSNAVIISSD